AEARRKPFREPGRESGKSVIRPCGRGKNTRLDMQGVIVVAERERARLGRGERLFRIVAGKQEHILAGLDTGAEGTGSEAFPPAVAERRFHAIREAPRKPGRPALGADFKGYRGTIQHYSLAS